MIFAIQPLWKALRPTIAMSRGAWPTSVATPTTVKFSLVQLFVAETAQAARDKQALHNSLVPLEGRGSPPVGEPQHRFVPDRP